MPFGKKSEKNPSKGATSSEVADKKNEPLPSTWQSDAASSESNDRTIWIVGDETVIMAGMRANSRGIPNLNLGNTTVHWAGEQDLRSGQIGTLIKKLEGRKPDPKFVVLHVGKQDVLLGIKESIVVNNIQDILKSEYKKLTFVWSDILSQGKNENQRETINKKGGNLAHSTFNHGGITQGGIKQCDTQKRGEDDDELNKFIKQLEDGLKALIK